MLLLVVLARGLAQDDAADHGTCDDATCSVSLLQARLRGRDEAGLADEQAGVCCYYSPVDGDQFCAACESEASPDEWCGKSKGNCEGNCNAHWCASGTGGSDESDRVALWGQCGGETYDGPTECAYGITCQKHNEFYSQCMPSTASPTPAPETPNPTPAPETPNPPPAPGTPNPPPAPEAPEVSPPAEAVATQSPSDPAVDWSGATALKATHFWDCSGAACDATVLATPWVNGQNEGYKYSVAYGPQDPAAFGGAAYGEKMWLTGAASDALTAQLGPDDACCGSVSEAPGGCGKCILARNPSAKQPDWTVVIMKKNRCPPWSHGCDKAHFDIAAPGFDNLQFSTANTCGDPGTTLTKDQSTVCGNWYDDGPDTSACDCSSLPPGLREGCSLFASWGWSSGDPELEYVPVACPPRFRNLIANGFSPQGPTDVVA